MASPDPPIWSYWIPIISTPIGIIIGLLFSPVSRWLDRSDFERRTRFSRLHDLQIEVITEVYGHLSNLEFEFSGIREEVEKDNFEKVYKSLAKPISEFNRYFRAKAILLSEPVCAKIDAFITPAESGLLAVWFNQYAQDKSKLLEKLNEYSSKLGPAMDELKAEFRAIIGVSK